MKRASTSLRVLAVTALTAMLMMCNIWSSLSNCETDAECTGTEICQLDVKRCVPRKANDVDSGATADAATEASSTDASVDSGRRCETLPWGKPTLVKGLENIPVVGGRLSPDELSMVLTRGDQIGVSNVLYTASRPTTNDAFTLDGPIPVVNANASAFWPTMTADGLLLFFESSRDAADAGPGIRIWTASRVNKLGDFSEPRLQSLFDVQVNGAMSETSPYVHPSGRSLYFASSARPGRGGLDIFVAEIGSLGTVTKISNVEAVNTATFELAPLVTSDDRYLYFARYTDDAITKNHIHMTSRSTSTSAFGPSSLVTALNSKDDDDFPSWVSPDHCRIYISSTRAEPGEDAGVDDAGNAVPPMIRLWVADRVP